MQKTNQQLLRERAEHVPRGVYNLIPIFGDAANGALIKDVEGREYIDFSGGIGVQTLGHCHPEVIASIKNQAGRITHTCFHVVMYESYVELAKRLNQSTPGNFPKKTFFVNSGAEAVDNAIKVARYATKRHGVIAFQNAYHGRTYMAMTLTSQVKPYKWGFGPFVPEVYRMPFAYCYRCPFGLSYPQCNTYCGDYLEEFFLSSMAPESFAALIIEPVQGEGGFIVPPRDFLRKISITCEKYGITFLVDEIQTGLGRTGKLFASEHFGLTPDIIMTGKALAAGLPLAGITGRADLMDAPHDGGLGGTFSGNPIACSAGLAVLDLLDEHMLQKGIELGKKIRTRFEEMQAKYEIMGDVRGIGPMIAVELVKDRHGKQPAKDEAAELRKLCFQKGLILIHCGPHHNVIRLHIPFVIAEDQLRDGLDIMEEGLQRFS